MQLVPVDSLLQRVALNEKSPEAVESANLQFQMEKVLQDSSVPPDVKVKIINNILLKEQSIQKPVGPPAPNPPPPQPVPQPQAGSLSSSGVANLLPRTYRNRAERLLNYLGPSGIKWNDKNQLHDRDDNPIPGTNIIDLIRYSMNTSKSFAKNRQPLGWSDFQGRLEDANVPNALAPGLYTNNDLRASYLKRPPSTPLTPQQTNKRLRVGVSALRQNPTRIVRKWTKYKE